MRKTLTGIIALCTLVTAEAQEVSATWSLNDSDNPSQAVISGDTQYTSLLTTNYANGSNFTLDAVKSVVADAGYEPADYSANPFTKYTATAKVSTASAASSVTFTLNIAEGHTFKVTGLSFQGMKVGTDKPAMTARFAYDGNAEQKISDAAEAISLVRNKINAATSTGYGDYSFTVTDVVATKQVSLILYGLSIDATKAVALRNVTIEGVMDEEDFTAGDLIQSLVVDGTDYTAAVSQFKTGDCYYTTEKLTALPAAYSMTLTPAAIAKGWTQQLTCEGHYLTAKVISGDKEKMAVSIYFPISNPQPKGAPTPMNRGLFALNRTQSGSQGNLVSWRMRKTDASLTYRLYRNGTHLADITDRTNYEDLTGTASDNYRLDVLSGDAVLETMQCTTWDSQSLRIPMAAAPVDERGMNATYTPNDGAFYDMDGDGYDELILKWDPSNSKDASSVGITSNTFIDCYKLSGQLLWRIDLGQNIRSGAHTTPFLCYDFDQDGFGELVVKTAPGTIDGEGNFVLMPSEATSGPSKVWYNTNNVPEKAQGHVLGTTPEYLTVFDGATGRELKTIRHPLPYDVVTTWGDDYGGRSDRYLAAAAYLDGVHPSIVWTRGYYYSASAAAVDWDGTDLTTRWVHTSQTADQGLWREGAHSLVIADVDQDGKDEIVYGAATLDDDGTVLYRTGLMHGDALHVSDFDLDNPGLEVFMVHEYGNFGYDLHDAKTGAILLRENGTKDTGRGLIADFSKAHRGSEYLVFTPLRSVVSTQEDKLGDIIADTWAVGQSGAAPNNRIYWDGDLQSEFYDKNIVASWNDDTNTWDRYQFSGSYYVPGTENNGTKRNPIVMGDLFGDWREEIVLWEAGDGVNNFVITATDIPTAYMIPTLRDDRQYDEAICWQNVGYNQPPHLSFDLYTAYGDGSTPVGGIAESATLHADATPTKAIIGARLIISKAGRHYNAAGAMLNLLKQ